MSTKFDPTQFKNIKSIKVNLAEVPGLYALWDWSTRKKRYSKRSIGNRFYAVKRINGKQVTKCFQTQSAAKDWIYNFTGDLHNKDHDLCFEDVMTRFFEKKKSDLRISTFETYQNQSKHLHYFKRLKVLSLTPKHIDHWLQTIKKPSYLAKQNSSRLSYEKVLGLLNQILVFYSEYICDDLAYSIPIKKRHRRDSIIDKTKYEERRSKNQNKYLPRNVVKDFLKCLAIKANLNPKLEVYLQIALLQFSTGLRIGDPNQNLEKT